MGKKIIIIGSAHPLRGGLAAYNERLARELIKEGNEVLLYNFSLQYPRVFFPGKTQYADWPAPQDLEIRTCINSINPFNWIRVGREIRKLCPELVIIKYWLPFMAPCQGTILSFIRRNKYTRVISILDNLVPHEKRIGDISLTRYFIRRVDAFVAMSRAVLNDLRKLAPRKPHAYSPHPLFDHFGESLKREKARKLLGLDPEYRYLLFFGFIRAYKGLHLILEALARDVLKDKKIKLIVAGEFYVDPEPYMKIIRENNLGERVVLKTDFIPDHEVNKYFCAADMITQPYTTASQSGVTQIAYHFNKPMLVTAVGGLPEMIPDGKVGYVVQPDPDDIAQAIARFYEQDKLEVFTRNVEKEKTRYTWDKMTRVIEELYNKIR